MEGLKLYTIEEIAEILRINVRTVRNLIRDRRLQGVRIGHSWRVSERALAAFVDENTTEVIQ